MANGTIDRGKKPVPAREVVAAVFLLVGPASLLVGVSMLLGLGGFLMTAGVLFTSLGVTMGFSRPGKDVR